MYIHSAKEVRIFFNLVFCVILLLFISGCSKNKGGDDTDPPVVNNVSGIIKKISISTTAGKAEVGVYEKDNLGRLITIFGYLEDSTAGLTSTLTGKTVFEYEGNEDRPIIYYTMNLNSSNQLDTFYKVFNYYDAASKIIKDSAIWIAFYNRKLHIVTEFSYSGNWVVANRKDYLDVPPLSVTSYLDSMKIENGNLTDDSFSDFGNPGNTLRHLATIESQFDNKINPLQKLNIFKYLVNQYYNFWQGPNNPTLKNARGVNKAYDQLKYGYEYSTNNYPLNATITSITANVERKEQVIKFFYQ